jgi:hypothetical protein
VIFCIAERLLKKVEAVPLRKSRQASVHRTPSCRGRAFEQRHQSALVIYCLRQPLIN